jgi:hypothetical protein
MLSKKVINIICISMLSCMNILLLRDNKKKSEKLLNNKKINTYFNIKT